MSKGSLLDTNVVSELRKGARADQGVLEWFDAQAPDSLYLSVMVIAEIRRGIGSVRRRDPDQAGVLAAWLQTLVDASHDRVLAVDLAVAERWAALMVRDPLPVIDALLAATALVHDLTLVTRYARDVLPTGVSVLNPFSAS